MFNLIVLLTIVGQLSGERVQILSNTQLFDDKYLTMTKSSVNERLFGFDRSRLCMINRNPISGWNLSIQEINSIGKSGQTNIKLYRDFRQLKPLACFYYNDHSYLIFQNENTNETSITKGSQEKVVKNFPCGDLRFDHIDGRLFVIRDDRIDEIDIRSIENLWIENNETEIITTNIGSMPSSYTDFLIIEGQIYLIKEKKIYKDRFHSNEILPKYVSETNSEFFNFVMFKEFKKIKVSSSNIWVYFLSILDLVVVVICISVLRILKIKKKGKNSSYSGEVMLYKELQRI